MANCSVVLVLCDSVHLVADVGTMYWLSISMECSGVYTILVGGSYMFSIL